MKWWAKTVISIVVILILWALFFYSEFFDKKNDSEIKPLTNYDFYKYYDEQLELEAYDENLCKNKDSYEEHIKEKYNVLDLYDFFDIEKDYKGKDKKTYAHLKRYDMIHNNELDTCLATYQLEFAFPHESPYVDWMREEKYTRYIVDSKDDTVLWEKSAEWEDFFNETTFNRWWDEFNTEVDKYRDNLSEWEAYREKENQAKESSKFEMIRWDDWNVSFVDIDEITSELFNKHYNDSFSDEEKALLQKKINEDALYTYPRYLVKDWPYSWWWVEIVDALKDNIPTVDIEDLELFTTEDYTYSNGVSEKKLTYLKDYIDPNDSRCFEYQQIENTIECPSEMKPISWTKMCFDLKLESPIDCNLIKF